MPAALFNITSSADYKLINRLLLHLRDWEYGEDPTWDNFYLITTESLPSADSECTKPSITEKDVSNNVWANKSIADIESFIIKERNKVNKETDLNLNTFTILDEQGVKDRTIILLDTQYNEDGEMIEDRFNKVRVPWEKAYIIWCNLDIANMDFTDFVEDAEANGDWWTYMEDDTDPNEETVKVKREKAIAELEKEGLA